MPVKRDVHKKRAPGSAKSMVIVRENLDDKIYGRLKASITAGEFAPGSRIVQEDLAVRLGVSRTPLVHALKRLVQEGLLSCVPRRGISVKELDQADLVSLLELRQVLEPLAARLAAGRMPDKEAAELRVKWLAMAGLPDTPASARTFIDMDRRFHWRLVELAGNPYLSAAMSPVNMLAAFYLHGTPRPWEDTVPDHLEVLDAIARGDPSASEEAMRRHISKSLDALRPKTDPCG